MNVYSDEFDRKTHISIKLVSVINLVLFSVSTAFIFKLYTEV